MNTKLRVSLGEPHPHMGPLISNYQDGLATSQEAQIVERHLLECEPCHDFYSSLRQAQEAIEELEPVSLSKEAEDSAYTDLLSRIDRSRRPRPRDESKKQPARRKDQSMKGLKHLINSRRGKQGGIETQRFDKFTTRARQVLTLAQEEAVRLNHNYVGTEHLLLGLIKEGEGIASKVLSKLEVELETVRTQVEEIIGRGQGQPTVAGKICLTPRSKRVFELAVEEARQLNHDFVGTEHLLLGVIREGEGVGADILEKLNISLVKVRQEVIALLDQERGD